MDQLITYHTHITINTNRTPYVNKPISIGSNATISTPQQHATVLSLLVDVLQPGKKALDIGCGSGYLASAMAVLVGKVTPFVLYT
jgi:protein-L-isoaspartate(D-aspartate) O-methyltransferase